MANILTVGNATLDIVSRVERYPEEDEEIRARSRVWRRGGNAANTSVVLSRLGHACGWAGVWAQSPESAIILDDLKLHGVDTRYSRSRPGQPPVSIILLSEATGSRTIVHYRDLGEFTFEDFLLVDTASYDWFHFEARDVTETRAMIAQLREVRPSVRISVEIEKARPDVECLYPLADVLMFSATFAARSGYDTRGFLEEVRRLAPGAALFCSRGAQGAAALDEEDRYFEQPAFRPPRVIDTVGAGDTFNAGVIDGYFSRESTAERLTHACRLAGRKCGHEGLWEAGEEID